MRLFAIPILTLVCLICAAPFARAEFVACNRSFDVVNIAIGRKVGEDFQTDGWWTIGTNQCATLIREDLPARYIYVFAQDVFGRPVVDGDVPMCVATRRFTIRGIEDCWTRGLVSAEFAEIDTKDAFRWTIFLEAAPE